MEGLTLYQISGRYAELAAREAHDETLTEAESLEIREELGIMLQKKSMGIIGYARNLESMAEAADAEIKRLQDIKQRIQKEQQRHYDRVKLAMEYMGATEITTGIGSLKIKNNPASVDILNATQIPQEFMRQKPAPPPEPDKKAIMAHFKETGELIPGVMIETTKTKLEIK